MVVLSSKAISSGRPLSVKVLACTSTWESMVKSAPSMLSSKVPSVHDR